MRVVGDAFHERGIGRLLSDLRPGTGPTRERVALNIKISLKRIKKPYKFNPALSGTLACWPHGHPKAIALDP
jgi:hypothetical protein